MREPDGTNLADLPDERSRFFGLALDPMLVCDLDGRISSANAACGSLLGLDLAALAGAPLASFLHPADAPALDAAFASLAAGAAHARFEARVLGAGGGWRLLDWSAASEAARIFASARDITDQRSLEREAARREREMKEAQRLAACGSFEVDLATQAVYWSEEMYRIFGVPLGEPVTVATVFGLTHPDDRPAAQAIIADGVAGLIAEADFEHRLIRPDGVERIFHLRASFSPDAAGRPAKFIGAGRDVTEQREAERRLARYVDELERASAHKDQFLGIVSHELRTPLNAIQGYGSILEDGLAGALSPTQARYLAKILESSDAMLALVNDLLDMSRFQAGKFVLDAATIAPAPVVREAAQGLATACAARGHDLVIEVPDGLPPVVADAQRLGQIVANLVGNAAKYTPPGGRVAVRAAAAAGGLRVEVEDTGVGIAEADLARVFEPFTQIDMSDTRGAGGVGLGLSIVKALVEAHRGELGVTSTPGSGSTFWFSIPSEAWPTEA